LLDFIGCKNNHSKLQPESGKDGWSGIPFVYDKLMDKQVMRDPSEITWEMIDKKLKEIVAARGRKGTGRLDQVEQLTRVAKNPCTEARVLVSVVFAQFDVNPNLSTHTPIPVRKKCSQSILVMLDILAHNPNKD
jgi:translation initiation factor 3 subunit C